MTISQSPCQNEISNEGTREPCRQESSLLYLFRKALSRTCSPEERLCETFPTPTAKQVEAGKRSASADCSKDHRTKKEFGLKLPCQNQGRKETRTVDR